MTRIAPIGVGLFLIAAVSGIRAESVRPMALDTLADRAVAVVEGRVLAVEEGVSRPAEGPASVHRYVTVAVDAFHRGGGDLPPQTVVLRELGGRIDDRVLEVPSAARYEVGERVLSFLSIWPDGALRTAGARDGKFVASADDRGFLAARSLVGERAGYLSRPELLALAVRPGSRDASPWLAEPPEWGHVEVAPRTERYTIEGQPYPARWLPFDAGESISVAVDPLRSPLSAQQTLESLAYAAAGWCGVGSSRIDFTTEVYDGDYVATHATSPFASYDGQNIVLFGDPYDDIDTPVDCSGTVAIGGYWRTAEPVGSDDGMPYYRILQMQIVFNSDYECFVADEFNLAEVAGHEFGHGLGFGHSFESDALMRPIPYGNRGARLGLDDRDAAHCYYPHRFDWTGPGGELTLRGGDRVRLSWNSTGPFHEPVSLQWSADDGEIWSEVTASTLDDGAYYWAMPSGVQGDLLFRISRTDDHGESATCSGTISPDPVKLLPARKSDRGWQSHR